MSKKTKHYCQDPCVEWMLNNFKEVCQHAGKHIAIHPTKGIVASDVDIEKTYQKVKELELLDVCLFDYISDGGLI